MPKKTDSQALVPVEQIERSIHVIRGQRVMLDDDLARLYGVPVKRLNEQVRRNRERFPDDFAFKLTPQEFTNLKSQFATSSLDTVADENCLKPLPNTASLCSPLSSSRR